MQVKINESFHVDAPIDVAWAMLSDPTRVVTCVPGAKVTEALDDTHYKGTVSMKVGPVVTNFSGDVEIEKSDAANHELILAGNGVDAKGKGSAKMTLVGTLRELDTGGTEVTATMEVTVIGKLAQFGSRLMEDVSKRLFVQFVECFKSSVEPAEAPAIVAAAGASTDGSAATPPPPKPPPAEPEPLKALPLVFKALGDAIARFFRRLFGKA